MLSTCVKSVVYDIFAFLELYICNYDNFTDSLILIAASTTETVALIFHEKLVSYSEYCSYFTNASYITQYFKHSHVCINEICNIMHFKTNRFDMISKHSGDFYHQKDHFISVMFHIVFENSQNINVAIFRNFSLISFPIK